jgi:peptidoglycan/LPS O-acetylase OafA/YrhL
LSRSRDQVTEHLLEGKTRRARYGYWLLWVITLAFALYAQYQFSFPGGIRFYLDVVGGLCTMIFVGLSPLAQRILCSAPVAFLGKHSFSLYLYHCTVQQSLGAWAFLSLYRGGVNYISAAFTAYLVSLAAIVPLAVASTRFVDQTAVDFSKWLYDSLFTDHNEALLVHRLCAAVKAAWPARKAKVMIDDCGTDTDSCGSPAAEAADEDMGHMEGVAREASDPLLGRLDTVSLGSRVFSGSLSRRGSLSMVDVEQR